MTEEEALRILGPINGVEVFYWGLAADGSGTFVVVNGQFTLEQLEAICVLAKAGRQL